MSRIYFQKRVLDCLYSLWRFQKQKLSLPFWNLLQQADEEKPHICCTKLEPTSLALQREHTSSHQSFHGLLAHSPSPHVFEAINTLGDDFLEFFVNMIESSMDYFPSMIHKFMDANFVLTFTLSVLTSILSGCTRDHQKKKEDFAPVPKETQPTEADDDGGDEVQFVDKFVGVDNQKKEDFAPLPEETQPTEADHDGGDEEQFVDKFVGVDKTINTVDSIAGQSKKDVLVTQRREKNEEGCKIGMEKNEEGCKKKNEEGRKIGMEKNEEGCKKKNEEGRKIGMEKNEEGCRTRNEGGRKIGMEKNEEGCKTRNEGGRKIGMEENEEGCKTRNEGARKIGMEKNEEGCKKKNEGGRKLGMEKNVEGRKIGKEKQVKAQPSSDAANVDKTHVRNTDRGITVDPVLRLFDSKWIQM
ncbi:uncharacterized protein LOC116251192 isoform X2 [Nymphaea colorata]|uniref:uncharacterized protein LOC116251192 isoform X2 n=1 Tax=Nymphaea colorata TaxID=210225 RepID=UPI00129EDC4F|nr:uncharacterized protein LOC116251192 isoform X2 [Nymphaea colorata]